MSHEKYILRIVQLLTAAAMVVVTVFILSLFGIVPSPLDLLRSAPSEKADAPSKIKRPQTSKNSTYKQYIEQGDQLKFNLKFDAAREAYQKASELEPRESLPYEKVGDVYFAQKDYDAAKENFELARTLNDTNSRLTIKVARNLFGLRKAVDAKVELVKIQPPTQESLYYLGVLHAFLNEQPEAKDALPKSIIAGNDETIKANAQKILNVYRDFDIAKGAEAEFLQATLAQALDQIGEYGLAIELCFNALKTKHDYRDVWIILGHAFLNENKWMDADDAFTKAIQLDSAHPAAFYFRGLAKRSLQKFDQAILDFEQSIKLGWKPIILAKLGLADSYFDLKNFQKAYPLYKDIVLADPADINRFVRPMALAINHLSRPVDAMNLARKALETHPNTAMAHNLLGWAATANNDFSAALQHLQEAIKRDPELPEAFLNLGRLAELKGDSSEAVKNYKIAKNMAEKRGNDSISSSAALRYNELTKQTGAGGTNTLDPALAPQTQLLPSLSLL
ncbi:MAG: tetratricopeptide repeat protein [Patescibacteria group bacterium]